MPSEDSDETTQPLRPDRTPAEASTLPLDTERVDSGRLQSASDPHILHPTVATRERIEPGTVLAGHYEIFDSKAGGMGCVYLAEDLAAQAKGLALKVAIKTVVNFDEWQTVHQSRGIPAEKSRYTGLLVRFRREAMNWVRLGKHANIILAMMVIEVGQKPYLVMEYADGGDLATWIRERRLTLPLAVNFAIQFCEGMKHAVRVAGMVHRDIKPANVLVQGQGTVKIADFGLAKAYGFSGLDFAAASSSDDRSLSIAGAGTLSYMAPEQFESLSKADTRSDIFSFGAMFYEMLTCQRLFGVRNAYEMSLSGEAPPPAHAANPLVPPGLSAIITRSVAYDPEDRYPSFDALAADLSRIDESLPARVPIPKDPTELPAAFHTPSIRILGETYSLISLGLYDDAARRAEDGIREDPNNAEHWINKGKALGELGNFAGAGSCFVRATELNLGDVHAWANLGWARYKSGDPIGGLEATRRAISLDYEFGDAWICYGCCKRTQGKYAEAVDALRRSTELEPYNWKAHANLGFCLSDMGQRSEALDALRRATAINPNAALVWYFIAWILAAEGRLRDARGAIDRSLQLAPSDPDAWGLRAVILLQGDGDVAGARACVDKALTIDPQNERARTVLGALS
jgi:serine/threonine protein kinase